MTDNKRTKVIVPRLLSVYDNAISKSVETTGIDIKSGKKITENISVTIEDVRSDDFSKNYIEDCINNIIYTKNNPLFYDNLKHPDFTECPVNGLENGFTIVKKSINQSKQKNKLWFDFKIIVEEYKKEYDINAYILGLYYGMRAYTTEYILCLNKLFPLLQEANIIEYNSFFKYCESLGYTKQNDETEKIDESKYQKGMNDLLFNTHLLEEE